MIKEIRLRYEAHAGTVIKLANKLTVLLGVNDHGKSAINRGINWVVTNLPRGDSMIPWTGKKSAQVEIVTDSDVVIRQKGPGNKYIVNGDELAAVGSSVPDEVSEALRLGSLNVQSQVDQFFLLQATPGEVAKRINAIAGIEESDKAIRRTNELINESSKQADSLKKEIKEHKGYLDEFSEKISAAERLYLEMERIETDLKDTGEALDAAKVLSSAISDSRTRLHGFPEFQRVQDRIDAVTDIQESSAALAETFRAADALRVQINSIDLQRFSDLEKADMAADLIDKMNSELERTNAKLGSYTALRDQLRAINTDKYSSLSNIADRLKKLEEGMFGVEELEPALQRATALAKELRNRRDLGIQLVDQAVIERIEQQECLVEKLVLKKSLLVEIAEKASVIGMLADEISKAESEIKELSEYCSECGRKLDETDHSHS